MVDRVPIGIKFLVGTAERAGQFKKLKRVTGFEVVKKEPSFRADAERAAREAAARRQTEISSFRGQVSFIGGERGSLESQNRTLEAEARKLNVLQTNINRLQKSLITRNTVSTNRLVSEFNKKSAAFNKRAESLGAKVDAFNLKASQSVARAGGLNISLSAKEEKALSRVEPKPVKVFVAPSEPVPGLAPFGLETQQARIEAQRRQEELRAFRERPPPRPFLEPITDFPKFVEERTAFLRQKEKEFLETAALFKPQPELSEAARKAAEKAIEEGDFQKAFQITTFGSVKAAEKEIKKRGKVGLAGLEIGTGAAGLGFVALGEPVIGQLPEKEVRFQVPFLGERKLTKAQFRAALGLSGELAFVPAVFKAPGAVIALPKAITATRLEFAGLRPVQFPRVLKPLGQKGELAIFEKRGPSVKIRKISKAEARILRGQGIILGKPGELKLAPLPKIKITPAEAKRLKELGVIAKPTAPPKFVTGEPTPGFLPRGAKARVPELGRFLERKRPLTFEEKQFLKSLRPAKPVLGKPLKAPKLFFAGEPTPGVIPRGPKVRVAELGRFLERRRPLTFEERAFEKTIAFQLKPMKPLFEPVFKPLPKVAPPTTAALRQVPQLSFKEFQKQLKAIEAFGKPAKQRFLAIPGSARALAFGLPVRPKGKFEEIEFIGTRFKFGAIPKELQIPLERTRLIQIQRIKQIPIFKTLPIPKLRAITREIPVVSQKRLQLILPRLTTIQARAERVKLRELQRQRQRFGEITLTIPKQIQIFKQPTPPTKELLKRPTGLIPLIPILEVGKPRKVKVSKKIQAFSSFVKKRGKFVKVSKRPLHKNTALALSLFVADKTAARTATIKKTAGKPRGRRVSKPSLRKFRNPIVGGRMRPVPNLFIEKSRFAIDSPGEKSAITARGLEALRKGFFRKKRKKTKRGDMFGLF